MLVEDEVNPSPIIEPLTKTPGLSLESLTLSSGLSTPTQLSKMSHISASKQQSPYTVSLGGFSARSLHPGSRDMSWYDAWNATSKRTVSSSSGLILANKGYMAISSPEVIQNHTHPISPALESKILNYRTKLSSIINGTLSKPPLVMVMGPNHIKDASQIEACSKWVGSLLGKSAAELQLDSTSLTPSEIVQMYSCQNPPTHLMLSVRANLANTTSTPTEMASKGNRSASSVATFEVNEGMPFCRHLLGTISEICPTVANISDTITPQYLSDLFCFGLVSSTLVESQLHRELVSGLSFPVGFGTLDSNLPFDQENYDCKVNSALDAIFATKHQHQFLSVTKLGTAAVVGTTGNDETFVVAEVRQTMSLEDIQSCINRVYADKRSSFTTPRIMLDVGKLCQASYDSKLQLVTALLTLEEYKYKILGVMVDSGDHYIPSFTGESCNYEFFINANKFVYEMELLSSRRYANA